MTDPQMVTYIYRDPLKNIPIESREGAREVLSHAFNIRSRESKQRRFGFSTSEDAVTWVLFTYLLRSGQLAGALRWAGLVTDENSILAPALLLWGVPIGNDARGAVIRKHLSNLCTSLREDPDSFSEPDVIIDLGEKGVIFFEVKYHSRNDLKPGNYPGWSEICRSGRAIWQLDDIKASGHYELARNWCLLKGLATDRPAFLVNLSPAKLFTGSEGQRLDRSADCDAAVPGIKPSNHHTLLVSQSQGAPLCG